MLKPLPLPYPARALAPYLTADAIRMHYGLYEGYVRRTNELTADQVGRHDLERLLMVLDEEDPRFEQAAQLWSHEQWFASMRPATGTAGEPFGPLAQMVRQQFGSVVGLRDSFLSTAMQVFGSGWVWLCWSPDEDLVIYTTEPTGVPMRDGLHPILVLDVWEHAYLPDYGPDRQQYAWEWFDMLASWRAADRRFCRAIASVQKELRSLPPA